MIATTASPITTADRIAAELADLGDDPDRIADLLWATDARGARHDESACPLARYLRRRLHLDGPVRVIPAAGRVVAEADGVTVVAPLPPTVRAFIDRFETGCYPELEKA
jgi:hypothetical protein